MSRLPAPRETGDASENGDFVANTKSAEKAAQQAEKHRARNVALRSRMRTAVRGVTAAIAGGNKEAAQLSYQKAVPVIPTPLKLRPAARRQHLLDMMRARVPLDRAPPKTS